MRKKNKNAMFTVVLQLPKDFKYTIDEVMEDEFKIACNKWSLSLNSDYKKNIMHHSLKQLESRVSNFSKNQWDISMDKLEVSVITNIEGNVVYELPSSEPKDITHKIFKTHDEFILTDEPDDNCVEINDFYDYYIEIITKWARSAVFYGVASYV